MYTYIYIYIYRSSTRALDLVWFGTTPNWFVKQRKVYREEMEGEQRGGKIHREEVH